MVAWTDDRGGTQGSQRIGPVVRRAFPLQGGGAELLEWAFTDAAQREGHWPETALSFHALRYLLENDDAVRGLAFWKRDPITLQMSLALVWGHAARRLDGPVK